VNLGYERSRPWSVVKTKTLHPAIAAMSPARAKVFAANASAITSKAGSFPDVAFRPMPKKPGIDLSSILHGWSMKKECN
jgi:hypothetical protein